MTIAEELAHRIGAITYADLPPEAVAWAKVGILDTVGVMLAGRGESCTRIVSGVAAHSSGPALLFGTQRFGCPARCRTDQRHGRACARLRRLQQQHGRPPVGTRAAGIVCAGRHAKGFRERLSRGLRCRLRDRDAHRPRRQFPSLREGLASDRNARHVWRGSGSAAPLGLSAASTAVALSLAASFASGIKANFGTMTKPLHVGHAARNGLLAALLAADGFTAGEDAFEHPQGFFLVFNGAGNFSADAVLADWAAPLDIVKPGHRHQTVPLLRLHASGDRRDAGARRGTWRSRRPKWCVSTALTHPRRLAHTNRPDPKSALDAKFSVQYCLARALLHGRIMLEHFEGDAYQDEAVQALLARIHAAPHPDMSMATTDHFGGEVHVQTAHGRRLSAKRRSPAWPWTGQAAAAAATGSQVSRLCRTCARCPLPRRAPCR